MPMGGARTSYGLDHRVNRPKRFMVGSAKPDSAAFALDCLRPAGRATLKVATDAAMTSVVASQVFSTTAVPGPYHRAGRIPISGLSADTTYYYGIDFGLSIAAGDVRSFTTPPADGTRQDQTFVFSSCSNAVSTTVWHFAKNIATDGAMWWAHCGDYGYAINPTDIHTLDEKHIQDTQRQIDSSADIDFVHKTVPVVGMLQNHDRAWVDAQWDDLSDSGVLFQDIARASGDVYQTRFPHYPLRDPSGYCLAQMFSWANVRCYVWDTMGQRHGAGGTTLGNNSSVYFFNQLDDFLTQLAIDDASGLYDVCFFLNSSTWQSIFFQSFQALSTEEIQTILAAVGDLENTLAILLSGDSHQWGIDDGTYTSFPFDPTVRLPQVTSSGLRQSSTFDVAGPWEWRGSPIEGVNAIGEVPGVIGGNYALISVEHTAGVFDRVRMKIRATPDDGSGTANDTTGTVSTLAEVTTDEEANEVSFLNETPTVAGLADLDVELEKSWLGACSVDYTCSHGPTGTVTFGPNRRRKTFSVTAPASGTFDITLSNPVGCTVPGTNPITATVV